ncbi:MAG: hypothetical protein R3A79_09500 [Nannocystaceae bacterium]
MAIVLLIFLLVALLAVLPEAWLELSFGYEEPIRLVLLLVAVYLWRWARAFAIAALPRSATLIFGYLSFRSGGQRRRLRAREVVGIDVVARPPDDRELFVIELRDGTRHDLCPVAWEGAGRLYRRLRRYLPRR